MNISYWLIALILSGILGASVSLAKPKKTRKVLGVISITGLVIAGITGFAVPDASLSYNPDGGLSFYTVGEVTQPPGEETQKGDVNVDVTGCSLTDGLTHTISGINKYTSSASGGTHRYKVNGNPAKTVSDAGTDTFYVGDRVQVLFMNGTQNAGYYSKIETFDVTCSSPKTLSAKLVANGTITMDLFNRDGDKMNSGANNQSMTIDDSKTLNLRLTAGSKVGFPYGGIIVVEYNDTEIDDVSIETKSGTILKTTNPTFYGTASTKRDFKTFEVQALENNQEIEYNVILESGSVEPAVNAGDVDYFLLTFYPKNPYINEDNGGAFTEPAVEDEDDARTYHYHLNATGYIS